MGVNWGRGGGSGEGVERGLNIWLDEEAACGGGGMIVPDSLPSSLLTSHPNSTDRSSWGS